MFLFRRHQARFQSERVANSDTIISDDSPSITTTTIPSSSATTTVSHDSENVDEEEGTFLNSTTTPVGTITVTSPTTTRPMRSNLQRRTSSNAGTQPNAVPTFDNDDDDDGIISDEDEEDVTETSETNRRGTFRHHTITLAELEEERELARRRSSACLLFALFILFRLWIFALQEGDFGLLILCIMASSWTARWVRHNRDHEEELDRRIANYMQNSENGNGDITGRDSLRMLSFQAQLALAIMESQRQMMQGGYGHPDGDGNQAPGVSDEARSRWKKFEYKSSLQDKNNLESSRRGSYGSVTQSDVKKSPIGVSNDEEPHCSICLGEYEDGEQLSTLPCGHTYHNECIGSWCSNHTRCPLCNSDLETTSSASTAITGAEAV